MIDAEERVPGGNTLEDTLEYLEYLDEYVDMYDVSCGLNPSLQYQIDSNDDREPRTYIFPHLFQNHLRETETILDRAAEFIGSFVVIRGNKLTHQIRMTAVDLNRIKSDRLYTFRRVIIS